jgi:hypothetical protein
MTAPRQVRRVRAGAAADVEQPTVHGQHAVEDAPRAQAHQRADAGLPQPRIFIAQLVPDPYPIVEIHWPERTRYRVAPAGRGENLDRAAGADSPWRP